MGKFNDKAGKEIQDMIKSYEREVKINELLFEEGVEVLLPFDEEGVIVEAEKNSILNFFPYKVKITKTSGIFHQLGDIEKFKADNLELKNKI